jgi:hypothetical protein
MTKMIQIRNVPDELHRTLKVRATDALLLTTDRHLAQAPGIRAELEPYR